jgi:hypothetical protein
MTREDDTSPVGSAGRRYIRRYVAAMVAYGVILFLVLRLLHNTAPPAPLKYLIAILPALPVLGVIWALGRFLVEETDEVVRAKMIQQLLWSAAATLSAATLWGFLEALADAPHLRAYWVFPVFCLAMLLSLPFVQRKYR